jgi:ADP-heptose:LPS heptosyltransferase
MLKTIKRILVIKLRDIGDIVLSTPVLNVLNENCPAPEIVYVLKKEYEPFKFLLPHVSRVITYDKNDPFDFLRLVLTLRSYKFDLAVNLHASLHSAIITLLSGSKFRLVHNHSGENYFSSVPLGITEGPKKNLERDLDTLSPLKITVLPEMKKTKLVLKEEISSFLDLEEVEESIGLGIGAKRPEKIWQRERFIELGQKLARDGHRVAVCCIEKERKDGEAITAGIGEKAKLYVSNFLHFAHYINKMRLFIGNDSALIRVAAAVGTKTVALFGPENPAEWHPYEEKDGHIAVSHLMEMKAGGIDVLDRKFREKSREPMDRITVDEVYAAALKLL